MIDLRHSVLDGGDGSARCALEYRRGHPGCSDVDVQDAVRAYRAAVHASAETYLAVRRFRALRPGVLTAEVLDFVNLLVSDRAAAAALAAPEAVLPPVVGENSLGMLPDAEFWTSYPPDGVGRKGARRCRS